MEAGEGCEKLQSEEVFESRCGGVYVIKELVNGPEIVQYTTADGTVYRRGDCVYLESRSSDTPFYICNLLNFKLDKKDNLLVHVKWYYRVTELPDQLYTLLLQDRDAEWLEYRSKVRRERELASNPGASQQLLISNHNNNNHASTSHCNDEPPGLDFQAVSSASSATTSDLYSATLDQLSSSSSPVENWLNDEFNFSEQEFKERELFSSKTLTYVAAKNLRGHCFITNFRDITEALEFDPLPDHFFFVLQYNPQNRRLANFKGEIKVGAAYQAVLPDIRDESLAEEDELKEESAFIPNRILDEDLHVFLSAARSLAATFANMRYGGVEHARKALSKDVVVIKAIDALHQADYDRNKAINLLLNDPAPKAPMDNWSSEDKKVFVKALRQVGKNFNTIRNDYLPHRTTSELVEFYYVWKKSPGAQTSSSFGTSTRVNNSKPSTKGTKPFSGKKKNGGNSGAARLTKIISSQLGNSGTDVESDDSIIDPQESAFSCKHCGTTASKNFVHWGADKLLLCFECRLDYQKYGRLPKTAEAPSPYLFKPVTGATGDVSSVIGSAASSVASGKGANRAPSSCSLPVGETASESVVDSPVQSPSVQKKKRKSRNSIEGTTEVYSKRAKQQREAASRSDTPSSESTESNETTSSGRQTTETTSTTPEPFEPESTSTNAFSNPLVPASQEPDTVSAFIAKTEPTTPVVEDIKKEPVANIVQELKPKLEAFSGQFPPIIPPSVEPRTCVPVGIATVTNAPVSTSSDLKAISAAIVASSENRPSTVPLAPQPVQIKAEPKEEIPTLPNFPVPTTASVVPPNTIGLPPNVDLKLNLGPEIKTEHVVAEQLLNVIVGRSGLTPPSSPAPMCCSDEVQIPHQRQVAEQSPNKRIFKLVRSWRRKSRLDQTQPGQQQQQQQFSPGVGGSVGGGSSNSCARTDVRCVPLFAPSFHSSKSSSSSHIKKEKLSSNETSRVPPSSRDVVPQSATSTSSTAMGAADRITTPSMTPQAGTFPQTPVTPVSAAASPAVAATVNINTSNHPQTLHPSLLNAPRTPVGIRGPHASTLPLQQLSSPLSALPQQRPHPALPTSSGGSVTPGWTPEEIAERSLRGDVRLNAELLARLKESANLHPGAGSNPVAPCAIPTSTAMAIQQLQQNEQALAAALLQQNLNPAALTPGALPSVAASALGSIHNLDPALMLRHIQEEQRVHEHLTAQSRLAQQLNSASAVAGHQQPQQQHHQHSHLHLHMHQQLAVAQAAAQAALGGGGGGGVGGGGIPPFPGAVGPSSLQSAAALNAAAASGGLNPNNAAAAAAAAGVDPAQLAALLGLPPFGNSSSGAAAVAAAQANPLLSASHSNPAANPFASVGVPPGLVSRERELQAQAAALAGLVPGGAAGASGALLSNHQQLMAAAAAANSPGASRPPYLPEDYLSALTNGHSQYSAQMAHEHELRRFMVLEQERRAAFAMNATSLANSGAHSATTPSVSASSHHSSLTPSAAAASSHHV